MKQLTVKEKLIVLIALKAMKEIYEFTRGFGEKRKEEIELEKIINKLSK